MNFFQAQDQARTKTKLLLFYFGLAILVMIASLDGLIILLFEEILDPRTISALNILKSPELWIFNLGLFLTLILPSVYQYFKLSRGGSAALIKLIQAQPLSPETDNLQEQILLHVVEEMSIAAGIPVPKIYILEQKTGINAFVAGTQVSDTILVVTRPAIEQLTRDELQGVIGHEFSHIFNNDMSMNLKLMGILSGIFLLSQIGYILIRLNSAPSHTRSKNNKNNSHFKLVLLGIGIYMIGLLGLLCGRIIKFAIIRQRELLADASGVQFTRNPIGLVGALMKIQAHSSTLDSNYAEELSHFCIAPPVQSKVLGLLGLNAGLFSTHPPLSKRLQQLDPTGALQKSLQKISL
jgi:Zn-dependent protease with chaperone function